MKFAYIAMGLKIAQTVMKTRGMMQLSRNAGGLASGIGTAVMIVAAARVAQNLISRR